VLPYARIVAVDNCAIQGVTFVSNNHSEDRCHYNNSASSHRSGNLKACLNSPCTVCRVFATLPPLYRAGRYDKTSQRTTIAYGYNDYYYDEISYFAYNNATLIQWML
jgi:hypothetical protein